MIVTKEDRIFKSLGLIALFVGLFLTQYDSGYKIYIVVPMAVVMLVLAVRKYLRDRKAGKPVTRYYIALAFILLSAVMAYYMSYKVLGDYYQ